jgi:hypothetical protein
MRKLIDIAFHMHTDSNETGMTDEDTRKYSWILYSESMSICELFMRLIGKYYPPEDAWKFIVNCVKEPYDLRILNEGNVVELQLAFDYTGFVDLSDYEKKKVIASTIMKAVSRLSAEACWDRKPFDDAYKKIIDLDYRNEYFYKERFNNRTRRYNVSMLCVHDVKEMNMFLILKDKKGAEIVTKQIAHTSPRELDYYKYLGKLKWESDTIVNLRYYGYKGHDWLFWQSEVSGVAFDFTRVIDKYEAGNINKISDKDVEITKLYGPERKRREDVE